jgi:hypothetical protein
MYSSSELNGGSLFMSKIEQIFEIELEKKQALFEQQMM